jgi:hypothetical protein
MRYKIIEILPGQLKVEYQDGSWAIVPILPNSRPEDIDHEVAKYDPEFLPKPESLVNYSVSVNEERISKPREDVELRKDEENLFVPRQYDPFDQINIKILLISEYFAQIGDPRLKNALINKAKTIINQPGFSIYDYINTIENDPEELFRIAEEELNNG